MEEGDYTPKFGQSYINVYLPREEDSNVVRRNVPPPSPVFSMSSIYKFSDDVIKDRHLFLGRKAFYHRYVKGEERRHGRGGGVIPPHPSITESPVPSDDEKDEDFTSINVVRLALDASNKELPDAKAKKRFNERLSAYVATQKKIKSAQSYNDVDGSKTPRETSSTNDKDAENNSYQRITAFPLQNTPRRPRREASFRSVTSTNITTPKLPSLERSKTYSYERDSYRKERSMWFPDSASWSSSPPPGQGRMPTRPSSKPHNIWRQSTEFLLGRKTPRINDLTTDKILYPHRTYSNPMSRTKSLA